MTQAIQMSPMQWSALPDIADVPALTVSDHDCLEDIRKVLIYHNALSRFGVHLAHKHFEVAEDEVLVEYTDVDARTLNCRVEKRTSEVHDSTNRIETMWSFSGDGATRVCDQQCVYNSGHANRHYSR